MTGLVGCHTGADADREGDGSRRPTAGRCDENGSIARPTERARAHGRGAARAPRRVQTSSARSRGREDAGPGPGGRGVTVDTRAEATSAPHDVRKLRLIEGASASRSTSSRARSISTRRVLDSSVTTLPSGRPERRRTKSAVSLGRIAGVAGVIDERISLEMNARRQLDRIVRAEHSGLPPRLPSTATAPIAAATSTSLRGSPSGTPTTPSQRPPTLATPPPVTATAVNAAASIVPCAPSASCGTDPPPQARQPRRGASAATWAEAPTSDVPAAGAATACTGTSDTATSRSDADAHARAIRWRASSATPKGQVDPPPNRQRHERHRDRTDAAEEKRDESARRWPTHREPDHAEQGGGDPGQPPGPPTVSTASALASTIVRRPGARPRALPPHRQVGTRRRGPTRPRHRCFRPPTRPRQASRHPSRRSGRRCPSSRRSHRSRPSAPSAAMIGSATRTGARCRERFRARRTARNTRRRARARARPSQ